jgi:hypothetical protein
MKTKRGITAGAAFAALAMAWLAHQRRRACAQQRAFEERTARTALETFEGEGGLVLA